MVSCDANVQTTVGRLKVTFKNRKAAIAMTACFWLNHAHSARAAQNFRSSGRRSCARIALLDGIGEAAFWAGIEEWSAFLQCVHTELRRDERLRRKLGTNFASRNSQDHSTNQPDGSND